MYALSAQLLRLPIISLQTGQTVAYTGQPIINPDNLELTAFHVETGRWRDNQATLLTQSLRRISPHGVVIDSSDDIVEADEIVRLQQIIKRQFSLAGILVTNESAIKLGRVEDFTVNLETFQIQKIYVRQSFLKNVLLDNLVIDRAQIIEVTNKQILVRDANVKKPLLSSQPLVSE